MTVKPSIALLLDVWCEDYEGDDITVVHDEADGSWRHGSEHTAIFHRASDNTHWSVSYRVTPGADYNDFRDGDLDDSYVVQVQPVVVPTTTWVAVRG
ncbi:hypothetical protein [Ancylobacter defluvii]|uniref:Uncharacterized protein n=1 Tax=Ancylobacter defluvii TaxID=1282440 RepID=A0A9W6JX45_9HYPH|nr:hypothetical protein [Ancylobacter defluvii]MBS7587059.1 hypothetical protein [Ancylobacter defluvii]GLK85471.1 hypothetical protein GCM10017653_35410 [Ancylobacter defluvii]